MSGPALIGIDWGSTALRAYLMAGDGRVVAEASGLEGILEPAGARTFEDVLETRIGPWLEASRPERQALPIVASGMIGSRNGLREAPYVPCPAAPGDLAQGLVPAACGRFRLWLVPGVRQNDPDGPDVMRGEETQILGALAGDPEPPDRGPEIRLLVLPGTHSKWVETEGTVIREFTTFPTGEIYASLLRSGSLAGFTAEARPPSAGVPATAHFDAGLAAAREDPGLLRHLFGVRARTLLGALETTGVPEFLSGVLLGHEIEEALARFQRSPAAPLTLVADGPLGTRYARALSARGLTPIRAPAGAAARGLFVLGRDLVRNGS